MNMKLRDLRNLFSHFTVEDNYTSTQEVIKILEYMNITACASEIDSASWIFISKMNIKSQNFKRKIFYKISINEKAENKKQQCKQNFVEHKKEN